MQKNRATNLLRMASKGQPLSAIAYFDEASEKFGALVFRGKEELEYQTTGTYDAFLASLADIGVKLQKQGQTIVQLIGSMAAKYVENPSFEKVA